MAFNVQTFLTRLGSAAIFSAIMLLAFLSREWAFAALFLVVNFLCLREYALILEKILQVSFTRNEKANFYFTGMAAYLFVCSMQMHACTNLLQQVMHKQIFYFLGLLIGAVIMFFVFRKNKKSVLLLTGIGYISIALGLLVQLRYQSLLLPVILLLFIWMNDTMAYLCGSFFGRTPFFPAISPKKTIEGTVGGILFTMAFAALWGYFYHVFPLVHWILFGLMASLIGTIGDLIESKLKRMAGIKDSGNLMPGHGGALDRFDSLLFTAPFAFLYALLCMECLEIMVF
ncbi:MAG: phosphatidate cytidylyltransferase [Chitinophagaceae bacterium]|nr:phosphatidate cytidylyltransferase [Chitinophagaceae bacterium]